MALFLKKIISLIVGFACTLTSSFFGNFAADIAPDDADSCKLSFAVISDIHMFDNGGKKILLDLGLMDMENADVPLDALVMAGDNTNNASSKQYELLAESFSQYSPANNIIMAMGNHDTWNKEIDEDDRFPESERLYKKYGKEIMKRDIDNVYFSVEVEGYTFIVLASENDTTKCTISDAQLAWLDSELAKAAEKELPVFVVSHWAIENTHGLPWVWVSNPMSLTKEELAKKNDGSFADGKSDDVNAVLQKYDNVFLISGHMHNGITNNYKTSAYNYSSVEKVGKVHSVNLPSYGNTALRGTPTSGMGFVFEVYDDEVLIKARGFTSGTWDFRYVYSIPVE